MYTPFLANTTNQPFGIEVVSAEGIYLIDRVEVKDTLI